MDWKKITEIAITCIASVGGIGAIIVWVITSVSDTVADRLSKKYQLQLDKEKEKFKTELSKKEYVSKTKFDAEFRMYQELSEKNISMVYCAGESVIITRGAPYSEEDLVNYIEKFCHDLNDAEMTNKKYAPFVSRNIFDKYHSLEKAAQEIFRLIKAWRQFQSNDDFSIMIADNIYHNQEEIKKAIEEKQRILSEESDTILNDLRDYLGKLDVLED